MIFISYLVYILMNLIVPYKLSIIFALVIAVITYFIMLIQLKIFSEEEIKELPKGEKIYKLLNKTKFYKSNKQNI